MDRIGAALSRCKATLSNPADAARQEAEAAEFERAQMRAEAAKRVRLSGIPEEYRGLGADDVAPNLRRWVELFGPGKADRPQQSLLFVGRAGRGKTHQACAVAMAVIGRCPGVRFVTNDRFLREYEAAGTRGAQDVVSRYARAKLLVFDDIGKGRMTDTGVKITWSLINERGSRPTIVTSQYDERRLLERLAQASDAETAEALVSRVFGMRMVMFDGEDRRRNRWA